MNVDIEIYICIFCEHLFIDYTQIKEVSQGAQTENWWSFHIIKNSPNEVLCQ